MGLILINNNNGGGFSATGTGGNFSMIPPVAALTTFLYWRLYTTSTSTGYWSIAELEMRSSVGGANILSGGTLSASSTDSANSGFPLSAAIDGNVNSFWLAVGNIPPHWIRYQFASPVDVQQIAIRTRNDFWWNETANNLSIQASNNGTDWTTIWTETGITGWAQGTTKVFTKP